VAIYNAAVPGRLATADTEPVAVASRLAWFEAHQSRRPLWVWDDHGVSAWASLQDFYGRPAYRHSAEVSLYVSPARQRHGLGRRLLAHVIAAAPGLDVNTLLAFIFAHNQPSMTLFERAGFASWGLLPRVAVLDGVERDLAILGLRLAT